MAKKTVLPNIFLTNQITDYVKKATIKTQKDFEVVIEDLYTLCEKFLARQLELSTKDPQKRKNLGLEINGQPNLNNRQVRKILAVIHVSWDEMINRLRKEKYLITNMIEEGSFRKMLEFEAENKGYTK